MDLNTEKLIKMLPLDEQFKTALLGKLGTMTPDQKFVVERAVWGLYDAIYALLLDKKIALALHDSGGLKLDKELYKKINKEVEEEMMTTQATAVSQVDLSAARRQLEELVKSGLH